MISVLLAAVVSYLLVCVLMYATQRSQIYLPPREVERPDATVVRLAVDGATLKIWVVPRSGPRALIYFGGNAEEVSWNLAGLAAAFPGHTLYLVNYRGYGGSTGRPTEAALLADALAVHDYVRARQPRVAVLGRSLGSGVAVFLASERPVERLVLVTPFDSFVNVARAHYWFLPVGLLLRDRYEAVRRAGAVEAPVLAIIAEKDELVPRACSEALVAAFAPGQARAVVIRGAAHNSLDLSPEYLASAADFLEGTQTDAVAGGSATGAAAP